MNSSIRQYQLLVRNVIIAEAAWWLLIGIAYLLLLPFNLAFIAPGFLSLLIIVPAVLAFFIPRWKWKAEMNARYDGESGTRMVHVGFAPMRYFFSWFFFRSVLFCVILALAQPAIGSKKVKASKRVLDIVVCLDISNSMNTTDLPGGTSRLTAAKRGLVQLINNLRGERFSVVVFANEAFTELPLTMDYGAAKMYINDISTGEISAQGTNIGAALEEASRQFADSKSGHSVLVITDGEDHEKLWKEQISEYNKNDIELTFFGIGTERGGKVPVDPDDPGAGYKTNGGSTVISRLDIAALKQMAGEAGATLEISLSDFPDMRGVISRFKNSKNHTLKEMEFDVQKNYYQLPLLAAILFLMAFLVLPLFRNID